MEQRWQAIRKIQIDYDDFYKFSGAIILVLIGAWIGLHFVENRDGLDTNIYTEAVGIAFTVLVIETLNRIRDERNRKHHLFRQMKSRTNVMAVDALEQIQHEGWLERAFEHYRNKHERIGLARVQWAGGVNLRGVNLSRADLVFANLSEADLFGADLAYANVFVSNLIGANLFGANLAEAQLVSTNLASTNLFGANLENVDLSDANLTSANLGEANLTGANLIGANLSEADLVAANLMAANLRLANLTGTNLWKSNLTGVSLRRASLENVKWGMFGESATLPDGTQWTPETDMERFTNPEHPDFAATLEVINRIRIEMGLELID